MIKIIPIMYKYRITTIYFMYLYNVKKYKSLQFYVTIHKANQIKYVL